MNKCPICGKRFHKDESDFYFCPDCQTKYHKSCYERFGCTNEGCSCFRGQLPWDRLPGAEESSASAAEQEACDTAAPVTETTPVPADMPEDILSAGESSAEISEAAPAVSKGLFGRFMDYNESVITCPDCGKRVSAFVWNYRLGCPVKYCLERKEHLYWRAGLVLTVLACLFMFLRLRTGLFINNCLWFAPIFILLYAILIHLGMFVKIRFMGRREMVRFFASAAQGTVIFILLAGFCLGSSETVLYREYSRAMACMDAGDYTAAARLFTGIKHYRNSEVMAAKAELSSQKLIYDKAMEAMKNEDFREAIGLLSGIKDYKDSREQIKIARYRLASQALAEGDLKTAIKLYTDLGDFRDSKSLLKKLTSVPAVGGRLLGGLLKKDDEDGPGLLEKGAELIDGFKALTGR